MSTDVSLGEGLKQPKRWADRDRALWLTRWWSLMGMVLFLLTANLWMPQTLFPQIPFFEFLTATPRVVDWICLFGIVIGLIEVGIVRRMGQPLQRIAFLIFAVSIAMSVMQDQHRLQPWAYQFFIWAIILGSARAKSALRYMRWITISLYLYSALSKFDAQFAETMGPEFFKTMTHWIGLDSSSWSSTVLGVLALTLPAIEFALALGLMFKKTLRFALIGIVAMHVLLVTILSPLGMNHEWGVLAWNVFLMVQAVILFGWLEPLTSEQQPERNSLEESPVEKRPIGEWLAKGAALIVLVFPLMIPFGGCDHWLGWEVYAPRTSRATLELPMIPLAQLPERLHPFVVLSDGSRTKKLDIGKWSLHDLGVPLNPQGRFQFAVASTVVEQLELNSFRIAVGSVSNRWSGQRKWRDVQREHEVERARTWFRLNTKPRD